MAVRVVQYVNNDGTTSTSVNSTTSQVTTVNRIVAPQEAFTTRAGVVLPVIGHNIVQNAVVSVTPPVNPYEGQVWIDIS